MSNASEPTSAPKWVAPLRVETENLVFRRPNPESRADQELYRQLFAALKFDRGFWGSNPVTDGRSALTQADMDWNIYKAGEYIISEDGHDIGIAGFQIAEDTGVRELETIHAMLPEERLLGHGTEARRAVLMIAYAMGIESILTRVHEINPVSIHVTEKFESSVQKNVGDTIYYMSRTIAPDEHFKCEWPEATRPGQNIPARPTGREP